MKQKDNYFYGRWGREMTAGSAINQLKKTIDPKEDYLVVEDGARFMGVQLKEEIANSLLSWGFNVKTSKKPMLTPLAVLEGRKRGLGIVVVTAGSSPDMITGFKVFNKEGEPLTGAKQTLGVSEKKGKLTNITESQTEDLFSKRKRQKPKKIIIGTTNSTLKTISKKLFDMHTAIFVGMDKKQPYKTRVELVREAVLRENSDAGFAMDDSGERFFLIDDSGAVWPGEWVQVMIYQSELSKRKGPIVCAVNTSNVFSSFAKENGRKALFTTTKEKDLLNALKKTNGIIAVKRGNITIPFIYNSVPDSLYCIVSFLNQLQKNSQPLSQIRNELDTKYGQRTKRTLTLQLEKSEHSRLKNFFREEPVMNLAGSPLVGVRDLQGIRTDYENGSWFWANTEEENQIEITMEADTKIALQEMEQDLLEQVKK